MPPPCRDSASLEPTSRGIRYLSCASSTCSLPSRVRARRAKMSRMSWVRSMTLRSSAASRLRSCAGESSLSKMTSVDARLAARGGQHRDLALAEERRRIGPGALLLHAQHGVGAGRRREAGQLVERMFRIEVPWRVVEETDERGAFPCKRHEMVGRYCSDFSTRSHGTTPCRTSVDGTRRRVDDRRRRAAARPGRRRGSRRRRAAPPPRRRAWTPRSRRSGSRWSP